MAAVAMPPDNARQGRHTKIQYGGRKPEVVIFPLLIKVFLKFQRLGIFLRTWPFQWTCALHRPTTSDTRKSNMEAKNWFLPYFSPPYCFFLVSGVVVVYCWRVGWNDRACKHNHTLWNCSNILTISVDVTTSGFPAAILDFLGVGRCRTMSRTCPLERPWAKTYT